MGFKFFGKIHCRHIKNYNDYHYLAEWLSLLGYMTRIMFANDFHLRSVEKKGFFSSHPSL